jgi:hypothetical protein
MSTVAQALAAIKTAYAAISVPAGFSLGGRVWTWPADRANVAYTTFPFILCAQALESDGIWQIRTQGSGFYTWPAEVLICLNRETSRDDVGAADEEAAQKWLYSAAAVPFANLGMGGTALAIGSAEQVLTTRIGNMGWLGNLIFWGVYVRFNVVQEYSLPIL